MAVVRSLRTGLQRQIAVRILILLEDEGLRRDGATYPDLAGRVLTLSSTDASRPAGGRPGSMSPCCTSSALTAMHSVARPPAIAG